MNLLGGADNVERPNDIRRDKFGCECGPRDSGGLIMKSAPMTYVGTNLDASVALGTGYACGTRWFRRSFEEIVAKMFSLDILFSSVM